ncbi:60S acidic ribosomal protein P0 [Coelomomyces lativittatus]|nr:60S acidic ribosomal protein P0 [Coelomomyces lativittatus]
MTEGGVQHKKAQYFEKLQNLLATFQSVLIVSVDNVGSNQMHVVRRKLREEASILMGKNTMVRRYDDLIFSYSFLLLFLLPYLFYLLLFFFFFLNSVSGYIWPRNRL